MYRARFTLPMFVLATVGVLLAGCGNDDDSGGTATDTSIETSAATDTESNAADVEFAQGMIPHHAQAVEMAQMVPDKDVTPELVELAGAIEGAQQPEIDQMTAMLERWGEDVPAVGGEHDMGDMEMEGMMSAEDMNALAAVTGAEFEQMWLTMMIEHHEGAIAMSETELADGSDQEAQTLAEGIIDAQQAEIAQMETMLD